MSYSKIPPRFAISLSILISLLIPSRQSCRIGYNVRDHLTKRVGILRSNYRSAGFRLQCLSGNTGDITATACNFLICTQSLRLLGFGNIGETHFSIDCFHFQLTTICRQFTVFVL